MSLISLSMATPFKEDIYYLPPCQENTTASCSNRKYKIIKSVEMVFAVVGIILFLTAVDATQTTVNDMLTCVFFGILILYPLLYLVLKEEFKKSRYDIMGVNIFIAVAAITMGGIIISSWYQVEEAIDQIDDKLSKIIVLKAETSATLKLISSLTCFLNAVIYLSESLIMILEDREYI